MANISIYDPRTMGKLVERMPKVQTFIKSTFFRNVETFDTQKIDVDFKKGNRQLAPFVHKKIGGVTIDNEGYETNTYEPPLVAPNKITTVALYCWKAKAENIIKIKKGYPEETKDISVDLNNINI